jgi:hypothetical protein
MSRQGYNIQRDVINLIKDVEITSKNKIAVVPIIKYLQKNRISLLGLNYSNNNKCFFSSNEFKNNLLKEKFTAKLWRDSSIDLLKEWEKNGIEYVFHKSIGDFPVASENLDVLVKKDKFKKAGEILKTFDYINARNIQEPHKEFYRKFKAEKIILPIHLHERVCWSVPFDDIDHIWNNYKISKDDPIVHYPAVEDSILVICAHHFLEDHTISLFDLLTLKKLLDKNDIDWCYIVDTVKKSKWEHSFYTILIIFEYYYSKLFSEVLLPQDLVNTSQKYVSNKKWIRTKLERKILVEDCIFPLKIPHLWTRIHTSLRELRDPAFGNKFSRFYQVFAGLLDRFIHLKLKFHNHPGFIVAVSSSKWHRTGSLPLTQFVLKLVRGKRDKRISNRENSEKMKVLPKNSTTIIIWEWLNFIDLLIFYFIKIQLPKKMGKVVLCDRYILDDIVDFESCRKTNNNNRFLYKIIMRFFPKPDLYFFVNIPIEIIKNRAKEKIVENIEKNYVVYQELTKQIGIEIIDNSQPFNIASKKFSNKSLSMFFSKFPDKYKGYKVISFRYK